MSDRYLLDSGDYYCVDCASVVRWPMRPKHDAFHDRIDRLAAVLLQRDREEMEASEPRPNLAQMRGQGQVTSDPGGFLINSAEPDPECPFPMGAKVQDEGGNVYKVTDWMFRESQRSWFVVCDHDWFLSPDELEPVPEPECPFPMGAKVRVVGWRFNEGTVTGWDFYPAWGRWLVRVDNGDDAGGSYALRDPEELELVPEPEPPVGAGWFADAYPGVLWRRTVNTLESEWTAVISNQGLTSAWMISAWSDLQPGRPAVPGGGA